METNFGFREPQGPADRVGRRREVGAAGAAPVRILVVEDQQDMREFLADVLCAAGYDALVVSNGLEAMRTLGAIAGDPRSLPHVPMDIVVTDLRMPVADGMDVLRSIRLCCPWVRTILVSAFATEDVRNEAEALGANAVLSKPFALSDLLGTIERLLHRTP